MSKAIHSELSFPAAIIHRHPSRASAWKPTVRRLYRTIPRLWKEPRCNQQVAISSLSSTNKSTASCLPSFLFSTSNANELWLCRCWTYYKLYFGPEGWGSYYFSYACANPQTIKRCQETPRLSAWCETRWSGNPRKTRREEN